MSVYPQLRFISISGNIHFGRHRSRSCSSGKGSTSPRYSFLRLLPSSMHRSSCSFIEYFICWSSRGGSLVRAWCFYSGEPLRCVASSRDVLDRRYGAADGLMSRPCLLSLAVTLSVDFGIPALRDETALTP